MGSMVLVRRNVDRGVMGRVDRTCHVVCRNGADVFSTLLVVGSRIPVDSRVRRVVSFVDTSGLNVVGWGEVVQRGEGDYSL